MSIFKKIPDTVLANRSILPEKPKSVVLEGQIVTVRPLDLDRDAEALFQVSNGTAITFATKSHLEYDCNELIWKYLPYGPFADIVEFREYLSGLLSVGNQLPFCVFEASSNSQIGIMMIMSNQPNYLKVELGGIWYSPIAQKTGANIEACYLVLKHLFELGYRRVEWKCDALNQRSYQAALKIGFIHEGIQQYHMIVKKRSRDTAWFRLTDTEWRVAKTRLETKLYMART